MKRIQYLNAVVEVDIETGRTTVPLTLYIDYGLQLLKQIVLLLLMYGAIKSLVKMRSLSKDDLLWVYRMNGGFDVILEFVIFVYFLRIAISVLRHVKPFHFLERSNQLLRDRFPYSLSGGIRSVVKIQTTGFILLLIIYSLQSQDRNLVSPIVSILLIFITRLFERLLEALYTIVTLKKKRFEMYELYEAFTYEEVQWLIVNEQIPFIEFRELGNHEKLGVFYSESLYVRRFHPDSLGKRAMKGS